MTSTHRATTPELSATDRAAWEAKGRLVLRQVLPADLVDSLTAAVGEVEDWSTTGGPGLHHFELTDRGPALARSEDFEPHQSELRAFLRSGIVVGVLGQLFGEPAALFKEKVNYKHPGGGGFAPHQDAPAYRFVDHHISVMVPIDPSTLDNGCLWFSTAGDGELLPNTAGRIDAAWVEAAEWEAIEAFPGDLVFFDSYAPHRSDTNTSNESRRAMYLTYNAASLGDFRSTYYDDKRAELAAVDDEAANGRARISISDDFLGRPVPAPSA